MTYETISITTDTKQQLARIKAEYGYDTYDALMRDLLIIAQQTIKQGGLELKE